EFSISLLERTAEKERAELLKDLDEAVRGHVLRNDPEALGGFQFTHPLIHQVLYADLEASDLVAFHRRVGEALEKLHSDDLAAHLDLLAHHFYQAALAGDIEKAIHYAVRAAGSASTLSAWEKSALHFEHALELLDLTGESRELRRCELLLGLGEARKWIWDTEASRNAFLEAAQIARSIGRPDHLAQAALLIGRAFIAFVAGEVDELQIRVLEEALSAVPLEDTRCRAMLLARLTHALYWSKEPGRCGRLAEEAVELGRRVGDVHVLAYALCAKYVSLLRPEITQSRIPLAREMTRLADETEDHALRLTCHLYAAGEFVRAGDRDALCAQINLLKRLAQEVRVPAFLARAGAVEALSALIEGRFADAEALMQRYLSLGQGVNDSLILQVFGAHMFTLHDLRGRLGDVLEAMRVQLKLHPTLVVWRCAIALILCKTGRQDEAR
ncbi:MAG: hypothetical protein ACRD1Z_04740, partial [Vicinamibacteria bacterium]